MPTSYLQSCSASDKPSKSGVSDAVRARLIDLGGRGFSVDMAKRMILSEFGLRLLSRAIKAIFAECGARTMRDDQQGRSELQVFEPPEQVRARWATLIGPMKQRVAAELSRR